MCLCERSHQIKGNIVQLCHSRTMAMQRYTNILNIQKNNGDFSQTAIIYHLNFIRYE